MMLSASICSCSEDPEEKEKKEQEQDKSVEDWENIDMNGDATLAPRMLFNVGDTIQVEGTVTTRATYTIIDEVEKCLLDENDIVTIEVSAGTGSTRSTAKKNYKVNSNHTDLTYYEGTPSLNEFHWDYGTEKINIRAWSYGGTVADDATPITDPDGQTISVEQNQKDNGYKELLYSPQQTDISFSTGKSGISLPLYHQMARVVVTLSKDNSDNPATISLVTIGDGVASIPTSAKFHKPSSGNYGTWGDGDNPITWTAGNTIQMKVDDAENGKYSAVLIPATYPKDMKFIYVIMSDNNKYAYILPSAVTLQSGKQYNYTINVKDLIHIDTDEKLTVSDITGTFTYNGSAHTPEPTVKYGTKTLTKDTHYTLSWTNNTNAGTATCTVTGIGPIFTGSVDKTFTINKATATLSFADPSKSTTYVWDIQNITNALTVTPSVAEVTYSSSNESVAIVDAATGTLTPGGSTGSATITASASETGNYTAASVTYTVTASANYKDFSCTKSTQSINLPKGTYKLQCWGASGGGEIDQSSGSHRGLGGYSYGNYTITESKTVYVFVGGEGKWASGTNADGGWNGGGATMTRESAMGSSGGGMTHISTTENPSTPVIAYTSTWNSTGTLIVAGGGGGTDDGDPSQGTLGGTNDGSGGYGGGESGGEPRTNGALNSGCAGTQSSGYKQGIGQPYTAANNDSGGGGGGWWGGKWGGTQNSSGGGGGSGYIGGVSAPKATIAGNQSFEAPGGGNETGHGGDGYARISWVSN